MKFFKAFVMALALGRLSQGALVTTPTAPVLSVTNTSALLTLAPGGTATIGFVVTGSTSISQATAFLVRAVGPTLSTFGVKFPVATPQFQLFGPGGVSGTLFSVITLEPIDWNATFAFAGAFPLTGGEPIGTSAGIYLLPAGAYTVQASDGSGKGGAILVEVYSNITIATLPTLPTVTVPISEVMSAQ